MSLQDFSPVLFVSLLSLPTKRLGFSSLDYNNLIAFVGNKFISTPYFAFKSLASENKDAYGFLDLGIIVRKTIMNRVVLESYRFETV